MSVQVQAENLSGLDTDTVCADLSHRQIVIEIIVTGAIVQLPLRSANNGLPFHILLASFAIGHAFTLLQKA